MFEKIIENEKLNSLYYEAFYEFLFKALNTIKKSENEFYNWDEDIINYFLLLITATG